MLLENKVAVIYGAGGSIGSAVARAFAREGASVHLAGRTQARLAAVANDIRASGGTASTAIVDALDEEAIDDFTDEVVTMAGQLDISFNLITYGDVQQPLLEISTDDFLQPIVTAMRSHFLTTRAAARHMIERGSGVILTFGGGGPQTYPGLGGFKIALDAIEGHRRQWACELGRHGVRVVTIKTGGIPETIPDDVAEKDAIAASIVGETLLQRVATLHDVGNVAAWVASDFARTITSSEVNISCGAIVE